MADQEKWRAAYRKELEFYASRLAPTPITSVFFGGGTPSLMEPHTVSSVLDDIARLWSVAPDVEITMEANPSSVEADKFSAFRSAGVNRLSLGIQSLNDDALKFFGRAHGAAEAKAALALAQKYFERTSFDLIYSYRGQTLDAWKRELAEALSMGEGHISLYQLTIEPHTQFAVRMKKGESLSCSDETAAEMFEVTQERTEAAGFPAYEISNHARPGQECRHNLAYWRYEDYIGIGPGAHGRYRIGKDRHAVENRRAPDAWLRQVAKAERGEQLDEILDLSTAMREAVLMGLRLTEGIDLRAWKTKFNFPLVEENALFLHHHPREVGDSASFLSSSKIARLCSEGLLERNEKALQATRAGLEKLNAILSYLLTP